MAIPAAPASQCARPGDLAAALCGGPIVLDGAMGTELEARGVNTAQALWSALALIEDPQAVAAVHDSYLRAGASVITTNSYQATLPALMGAGLDEDAAQEVIASSARIALGVAGRIKQEFPSRQVVVAGSLGPYGAYLADGSEYTGAYGLSAPGFEAVHLPRIEALLGAGIRVFAVETQPRLDEAQWIVEQIRGIAPGTQCWASFQVGDDGGHLADGTPIAEAGAWAQETESVIAVGVNCVAPQAVLPALRILRAATSKPLVAYSNSGDAYHPDTKTWTAAGSAERFTAQAQSWLEAGARLIGGCCRTTPADTAVLAAEVLR